MPSVTVTNEVSQFGTTRSRERLTGDAASYEFNVIDTPSVEMLEQVGWVTEIADPAEATDVGGVGLDGPAVDVGADHHGEPRILKPKAQTACTAEEIQRARPRLSTDPVADGPEVSRVGGVRMPGQPGRRPAVRTDDGTG